ncbi:MAG: peptidase S53 [Kordia sp.]|nr:MAG: peptidase S53 [Kordia sp.]
MMVKETYPGLLPMQIAKHYGFPLQYTGKEQSIAIISLGGEINMDELKKDFQAMRVPMPDIKVVLVEPESITTEQNQMPSGETHLDVEVIGSICPEAKITIYRGPNPSGLAAAVKKAVADKNSVISISWGASEISSDHNSEMESVLENAIKEGVTVCVSAGDGGSSDSRNVADADGKAHVGYPASSHHVLACGGTELLMKNGERSEVVWNNSNIGRGATGGGVSQLFGLPSWQSSAGIKIPSINTGKIGRVIPDVAGLAAGGDWKIYQSDKAVLIGGTSAVAPLWASLIALINEARAESGKSQLGFVNERLYDLAANGDLFTDITIGNNKSAPNYPGYDATSGFDACSGWGTPIGSKLFEALTKLE